MWARDGGSVLRKDVLTEALDLNLRLQSAELGAGTALAVICVPLHAQGGCLTETVTRCAAPPFFRPSFIHVPAPGRDWTNI